MLLSHRSGKKLVVIFILLSFTSKINITMLYYCSEVLPNRTCQRTMDSKVIRLWNKCMSVAARWDICVIETCWAFSVQLKFICSLPRSSVYNDRVNTRVVCTLYYKTPTNFHNWLTYLTTLKYSWVLEVQSSVQCTWYLTEERTVIWSWSIQ